MSYEPKAKNYEPRAISYKLKHKHLIIIASLLLAIVLSFAFPRTKYTSTNFISHLKIPYKFAEWQGKDVTSELNIQVEDDRYSFLGDFLAHEYINIKGENLLFIILDAGNFHHPNVCFTSSGFKLKELNNTEFNTLNHTFKAHTVYTQRERESFLVFYWIVIDKDIAHEWIEQKAKQLYFSMFNKKRVGLMVRIDIPTKEENIEDAFTLAKQFINDLSQTLPLEQADYIFGEK